MAFFQLPLSPGGGATEEKPLPRSPQGTNDLSDWGVPMRRALVQDKDDEEPSEATGVKGRVPLTKVIGVPIDAVGQDADESCGIIKSPGGIRPERTSSRLR